MSDSNGTPPSFETEDEALQVLLDADIDRVMAGLDRIVEAAPSYEKLFSRWENQQWNSESFDFSEDKAQWETATRSRAEQKAFIQWSMSSFFLGEERVTTELLPFAIAAPSHEARAFLATQISDEAKHMVFFDRFYREVFGVTAETLSENVNSQRSRHERRVRRAVRRDPARLRRDAAQGPLRHGRPGARRDRLHGRDRGHPGAHRRPLHDPLAEGDGPAARLPPGLHRGEPRRVAPRRASA